MGDIREEKKAPRRVALVPWVMHSHNAKCTGTLCYQRLHTRIHGQKKRVVTVCSSAIKTPAACVALRPHIQNVRVVLLLA